MSFGSHTRPPGPGTQVLPPIVGNPSVMSSHFEIGDYFDLVSHGAYSRRPYG